MKATGFENELVRFMLINKFILFGFLLRLAVSIWNAFFGPSFGAELDAATFHIQAVENSNEIAFESLQVGFIYVQFLGLVYFLTTPSLFLGSLLSSIVWLISAIYLHKTTKVLEVNNVNTHRILFVYAFLPSSLLYTSVTLRESYQLLFITLAVYAAIKIINHKSTGHWLLLGFSLVGAGVLHGALMAFSVVFLCLLFLILANNKNKNKISWLKIMAISPLIVFSVVLGLSLFSETAYQLDDGLTSSVQSYQEGGLGVEARANYKTDVAISGFAGLPILVSVSLFQYLFEPMPWRISSVVDIPVVLENILRFWLIYVCINNLKKNKDYVYHRSIVLVFLSYLVAEVIWSLGTINWGTASRHHIPSIGMLLIAAFATRSAKKQYVKLLP